MNCSEVGTGFGVMPAAVILTDIDHHPANDISGGIVYVNSNTYVPVPGGSTSARSVLLFPSSTTSQSPNETCVPSIADSSPRCVGQGEYLPDAGSQLCADVFFLACEKIQFWGAFHDFIVSILSAARRWIRNTELDHVGRIPYLECIPHYGHIPSIG